MQTIVDDYVKSEAVLKESRLHAELDLDVYLTSDDVIAATRDTMEDTIDYINTRYGSAADYLTQVLVTGVVEQSECCHAFGASSVCQRGCRTCAPSLILGQMPCFAFNMTPNILKPTSNERERECCQCGMEEWEITRIRVNLLQRANLRAGDALHRLSMSPVEFRHSLWRRSKEAPPVRSRGPPKRTISQPTPPKVCLSMLALASITGFSVQNLFKRTLIEYFQQVNAYLCQLPAEQYLHIISLSQYCCTFPCNEA